VSDIESLFDSYQPGEEDYKQLKREQFDHAERSIVSLKNLGKVLSMVPEDHVKAREIRKNLPESAWYWPKASHYVQQQFERAAAWLQEHADDLPSERYNSDRQELNGMYDDTWGNALVDNPEYFDHGDESGLSGGVRSFDYEAWGQMDVSTAGCYEPLAAVLKNMDLDAEEREFVGAYGPEFYWSRFVALEERGKRFQRYQSKRKLAMRWGPAMQTTGAVWSKASAAYDRGYRWTPAAMTSTLPPVERLRELLRYDPETGELTWAVSRGRVKAGSVACTVRKNGKLQVRVEGHAYYASRVVWALFTGQDPGTATIRFKDGDSTNLAWSNLSSREAGGWYPFRGKWRAIAGSRLIGVYENASQAATAFESWVSFFARFR